ncbi:MAG TPA: LysR family transcriptional regulator, partial [Lachnospiraceae bacterium]|nr:LysR family transcriptional regulator [Lachnospiraceae bacterium]
TGSLRLGGSSLFSSYVLPRLVSAFTNRYPAVQIELTEESTANLEQLLAAGVVDIVIDNSRFDENVFGKRAYQKEHLVLAVPRRLPVNEQLASFQITSQQIVSASFLEEEIPAVPLEKFQNYPFILLKPENDTRQRGIRLCREHGFQPQVMLELDQQATAYNITCSGMGISFISDTLIRAVPPHPEVVFYKLDGQDVERTLYFYWKQGKYLSRAMEEFLRMAAS